MTNIKILPTSKETPRAVELFCSEQIADQINALIEFAPYFCDDVDDRDPPEKLINIAFAPLEFSKFPLEESEVKAIVERLGEGNCCDRHWELLADRALDDDDERFVYLYASASDCAFQAMIKIAPIADITKILNKKLFTLYKI